MPSPLEPAGIGAGARALASISSFGAEERLRLPFDLQRYHVFLAAVAAVAMAVVAGATGFLPIAAAGLIVAIAVGFAVALSEMFGLVLLAAIVPAASGLARGVPLPGIRLSQAVAGGVGIILLLTARRFVRWKALDWLALLYAIGTFVLGFYDLLDERGAFGFREIQLLLGPLQFLLIFRATAIVARTPERRRLVLRVLLWASVPVALLAIGQQFNFPGVRSLLVTLTRNDVYAPGQVARVTGPFPLWHNLGGYTFMILLTIGALLFRKIDDVLSRPVLLGIGVLNTVALVETLSIAPIAGAVIGLVIIGVWLQGVTRVFAGLAAVLLIGALVFGSRLDARFSAQFDRSPGQQRSALVPQTIQYRYDLWTNQLLPLIEKHPMTGYGPDLPSQLQNFPYTESLYINLLFRGGVVLLAIGLCLFHAMIRAGLIAARTKDDPLQRALGVALATAVLCLIFMQSIEAYFVDDGTPQVLWILLGLLTFRETVTVRAVVANSTVAKSLLRRAWAEKVAMALDTLDPGSRELLEFSYRHRLSDEDVVGVMGLTRESIVRWRSAALRRLAMRAQMDPAAVEDVLRSEAWTRGPGRPGVQLQAASAGE